MTTSSKSDSSPASVVPDLAGERASQAHYRVMFISAAEPDVASGTPIILCDVLAHFPPGDAEVLCERNYGVIQRRQITLRQRVNTIRFPNCLWPFRRGSRLRRWLTFVGLPWVVFVGLWQVIRFRPTCVLAIYWRTDWILAAYLIARLGRVPLVYYVHDTLRENFDRTEGLAKRFVAWLEPTVFRAARVLVLHPYLADHYRRQYGFESVILRQVVRHKPLRPVEAEVRDGKLTIGFAGAIYDNNARQLTELAAIVNAEPRLRLTIWTDASPARLRELGIAGERIEIAFEANHERLLERLSGCDLLYLPLAFADSTTLTTSALQFAFPTKSLDYLVAGPPILVHCPENYELSGFFREHACGHVLNDGEPAALGAWLRRWIEGGMEPLDDAARQQALTIFSPEENRRLLWRVISEVAPGAPANIRRQLA